MRGSDRRRHTQPRVQQPEFLNRTAPVSFSAMQQLEASLGLQCLCSRLAELSAPAHHCLCRQLHPLQRRDIWHAALVGAATAYTP